MRFELARDHVDALEDANEVFPEKTDQLGFIVIVDKAIALLSDKVRVRLRVDHSSIHILRDVAETKLLPPATKEVDIVKDNAIARIELAAQEDPWQQRVVNTDVPQSKVLVGDLRIGATILEWIQKTARVIF